MNKPPKSPLGRRLKKARDLAELSGRDLSDLAKASVNMVSLIERGVTLSPRSQVLENLADVLGISLDWLVRGLGPEPTREQIRTAVDVARTRRKEAA